MRVKLASYAIATILVLSAWIWIHYVLISGFIFAGKVFAELKAGFGTVEGHITIGRDPSPSNWDMFIDSTPYSELNSSDFFHALEERRLLVPESADPFSDFAFRPPLSKTLFGFQPALDFDRSADHYLLTVSFPYFFIFVFLMIFALLDFLRLKTATGAEPLR
jgi:hypothetical protein